MIRVLTVADLQQMRKHHCSLARGVSKHHHDVVTVVGDWLDIGGGACLGAQVSDQTSSVSITATSVSTIRMILLHMARMVRD
jgi:hypothetical protein